MANDKYNDLDEGFKADVGDSAVRARNRTVMLTPEMTGQVRARLSRDSELEERGSGSYGIPQAEADFVAPRIQNNYEAAYENHKEQGFEDELVSPIVEDLYASRPSGKNGFNPITREIHQVASPVERRPVVPPADIPPQPAPQRREVVNRIVSAPAHEDIESSLPYMKKYEEQPSFDPSSESIEESSGEDKIVWVKSSPVVGFLVSFDLDPNGQVFFIRSGRAIVSAQIPNGGNYLLLNDETVSPMHAILRVTEDAQIQVLDNLSEYGTTVVKSDGGEDISLSGDKAIVHHGDILRFGKRSFSVCLIGR